MPGSRDTSFIPKHTSNTTVKRNSPKQLFIGTILVRVLFFAVMIATAVVFFYERKLGNELAADVVAFREATKSFEADEEKLQTILAMDKKLIQARERLDGSVSILSILKAIEVSAIATTRVDTLEVERDDDNNLALKAAIKTESFDSVIFQRSILEQNETLKSVAIKNITINDLQSIKEGQSLENLRNNATKEIAFEVEILIDASLVPPLVTKDTVGQVLIPVSEIMLTTPSTGSSTTDVEPDSNQTNL